LTPSFARVQNVYPARVVVQDSKRNIIRNLEITILCKESNPKIGIGIRNASMKLVTEEFFLNNEKTQKDTKF